MAGMIRTQYRRRMERKTDYFARRRLLEGKKPRVVVRKTNRYVLAQLVESKEAQDKVICSANSKELINYGWPDKYSIKNIPACYLTGFLLGKKMKQTNHENAILDSGLIRSTKGNKIYAVLKGVIDSGIEVPHSKEILPSEDRIKGSHVDKSIQIIVEKTKEAIIKK
jgi:large subunit ribosomal protein L18